MNIDREKDVIDVFNHIVAPSQNDTIRKSKASNFSVLPAIGYAMQTGFAAALGANTTFAVKKGRSKISSVVTSITYSQYKQVIIPLDADIWTADNKYKFVTDCRYMKYPSVTYGLGPQTKISDGYSIDFNYLKIHQTILRGITQNFFAGLGYFYDHFWKVSEIGLAPNVITDFQQYGITKTVNSSGIAFRALYDSRDNPINTQIGSYVNVIFKPDFMFLGSDNNDKSLQFEIRKFIHLPARSKNVLAIWSYNWLSPGAARPPYLMLPSTGWDDLFNTGRGYIQGRYRERELVYLETEDRFLILKNGLVGGVVFVNAQSVGRQLIKQSPALAFGAGVGLRIKLNKFSGTNLCIDYGFGSNGSRGLAINLGEIF